MIIEIKSDDADYHDYNIIDIIYILNNKIRKKYNKKKINNNNYFQ